MFDGNHRVRRAVNLSGRSSRARRTAASSSGSCKESVLETARQRRLERLQQQQETTAAVALQTLFRRYAARRRWRHALERRWKQSLTQSQQSQSLKVKPDTQPANTAANLQETVTILNVLLQHFAAASGQPQQEQWLHQLAHEIRSSPTINNRNKTAPVPRAHCILQAVLQSTNRTAAVSAAILATDTFAEAETVGARMAVCQTILDYILVPPPQLLLHTGNQNTLQQQQQYWWKILGGGRGYGTLIETVQALSAAAAAVAAAAAGIPSVSATDASLLLQIQAVRITTGQLLVDAAPACIAAHAVLGATVLADPTSLSNVGGGDTSRRSSSNNNNNDTTLWVSALVAILTESTADGSPQKEEELRLGAAAQRIVKSSRAVLLSNAMDLTATAVSSSMQSQAQAESLPAVETVLQLLQYVLLQTDASTASPASSSVLVLATTVGQVLANAGSSDSVKARLLNKDAAVDVDMYGAENDDDLDEEDLEDEEMPDRTTITTTTSKKARTTSNSTGRLTKRDLQTVPKLDRLYQEAVASQFKQVFGKSTISSTAAMLPLATRIGQPEQWLQWGRIVLMSNNNNNKNDAATAKQAYVTLLAVFLQGSTGLRPRQSGANALLTKLAFAPDFLGHLWQYCQSLLTASEQPTTTGGTASNETLASIAGRPSTTYLCLSVFCDLFAHNLVALKDDQFLTQHTTRTGATPVILAEEVIVRFRDLLYELYWVKPVRADWVQLPFGDLSPEDHLQAAQARLLLLGTKLWNSLYERWCRLLRHAPFCDESTWLFPHMASLTGDNAVSRQPARDNDNSIVSMDVDSDDDDDDEGAASAPVSAADAENDALADVFSDPKMARILTCIPQALPFGRRVKLFDSLLKADKARTQDESAEMREVMLNMMRGQDGATSFRERVEIRRDKLYDDSMRQLNRLGPKLKKKVQVTFVSRHGTQEAGIDGGGVFKEFIDDLIKDAFQPDSTSHQQLFSETPLQTLAVSGAVAKDPSMLSHYEFLGRVLGKAVYESILVEPQFCLPFLNQLLGKVNSLEDLKNFDTEYYNNLTKMLALPADQLEMAGLTFELTLATGDGKAARPASRTIELVPDGRNKLVTKQNVIQYVHLVAHQRLNVEGSLQTRAFLRGFRDLIAAPWVRIFSAYELQKLISGDDSVRGLDVQSLQQAMQYAGGYHPSQPAVQWFWQVVEELTPEQQRKFLKFMTSCSRQPLLGFGSLEPAPCLQQIRLPDAMFLEPNGSIPIATKDDDTGDSVMNSMAAKQAPLPTSSTCMNLLKLPNYRSKELLRRKLVAAIEAGAGFELS